MYPVITFVTTFTLLVNTPFAQAAFWSKAPTPAAICDNYLSENTTTARVYGINAHDAEVGMQLEHTRPLLTAIAQAVRLVDPLPTESFHNFGYIALGEPKAPGFIKLMVLRPRHQFPQSFYDQYFSKLNADEDLIKWVFYHLQSKSYASLSPESLLVLAYATRQFVYPLVDIRGVKFLQTDNLNNFIRDRILKFEQAGRLPLFRAIATYNPQMLVKYVKFAAASAVVIHDAPYEFSFSDQYASALKKAGDIGLDQMINLAYEVASPELGRGIKATGLLELLLTSNVHAKRTAKWLNPGAIFMSWWIHEMMRAHPLRVTLHVLNGSGPVPDDFLVSVGMDSESKEGKFLHALLTDVFLQASRTMHPAPQIIQRTIQEQISDLGNLIRHDVRVHERAAEAERLRQLKANAPESATYQGRSRGPRDLNVRLPSEREEVAPVEVADDTKVSTVELLEGALPLEDIRIHGSVVESERPYYFQNFMGKGFESELRYDYLQLTPTMREKFVRQQFNREAWVRAFLNGPVRELGANGMKRIRSSKNILWEIKMGSTGQRVIVQQIKATRTWIWWDMVDHDKVDEFRANHRL